jgi:hypothetical protein
VSFVELDVHEIDERNRMEPRHLIFGIHIDDRVKHVPNVQKLFTEYGCNIKTRIGLHHVEDGICSPRGLILLEMHGDDAVCHEFSAKL